VADPSLAKPWTGFNLFSRADGEAVQAHLAALLAEGRIRTVVGRTARAEELPAELQRLADRQTTGRTVLRWT
jgi:NADPH2:quinone reductase